MITVLINSIYTYGTTDVTRTWYFGTINTVDKHGDHIVNNDYIDSYTRVLKGNIGVDTAVFPENTPGFVLDVFARQSLWLKGKNYGHGTGHGVGAALNVHEGPMSIGPRWGNTELLRARMVVSNEPGYYKDGEYGIRIENLLEIQLVNQDDDGDDSSTKSNEIAKFLKFRKLTMVPIQKNLINVKLLTDEELDWLDNYHKEVYETVSSLLDPDSIAMKWLKRSCSKIERN
jgi:Xaa-Pro aminopeptidase